MQLQTNTELEKHTAHLVGIDASKTRRALVAALTRQKAKQGICCHLVYSKQLTLFEHVLEPLICIGAGFYAMKIRRYIFNHSSKEN